MYRILGSEPTTLRQFERRIEDGADENEIKDIWEQTQAIRDRDTEKSRPLGFLKRVIWKYRDALNASYERIALINLITERYISTSFVIYRDPWPSIDLETTCRKVREDKGCLSRALLQCIANRAISLIKPLIEVGADVNWQQTRTGIRPLHLAVRQDCSEIVHLLLKFNAKVNVKDERGLTPLHWAAYYGYVQCSELLLDAGANLNSRTNHSSSPLHLAALKGHVVIIDLLLKNKQDVDLNAQNDNGQTPLHLAIMQRHFFLVSFLIKNGANPNKKTRDGKYPLELAEKEDQEAIHYLLFESKAQHHGKEKQLAASLAHPLSTCQSELYKPLDLEGSSLSPQTKTSSFLMS